MIGWFRSRRLSQKLTLLFAGTSALALLAAFVALWIYEWHTSQRAMEREMVTLSATLADSGAAALAFRDNRAARETLAVLRAEPRALAACLYRVDGTQAASYGDHSGILCPPKPAAETSEFKDGQLVVVRTSRLNGEDQGAIWLCADLTDMNQQLTHLAQICAGVMLGAILLTVIVSSTLQRLISGPILRLAAIAGKVSADRDYSLRATRPAGNRDELGILFDRFNEMMRQIYERDIALEEARDALEQRVLERTSELKEEIAQHERTENELVAAKELAEESNQAKSVFLANMSHELRTPLNAIIGYSEILEEDQLEIGNGSAVTDLRRVKGAALHLLELIQDILDLSRVEAGRLDLHIKSMSARDLISDLAVIEPLARKNNNRLVVLPGSYDFRVDVDPMRFRQALLNLLSNACKFTENGTVTLIVHCEYDGETPWIWWTVRDTGPGIAPGDFAKLFRSFSQVDSSATRKHGGTGLGLAISQRFCQLMGGRIQVESKLGEGSAFSIVLPEAAEPVESREASKENKSPAPVL